MGAYSADSVSGLVPNADSYTQLNFLQETFLNASRLGIPVVFISETLHSSDNNGTAFPSPALLGCTWDVDLIQRIGAVIGLEARTSGITRGFAPVLQV